MGLNNNISASFIKSKFVFCINLVKNWFCNNSAPYSGEPVVKVRSYIYGIIEFNDLDVAMDFIHEQEKKGDICTLIATYR